MRQFAVLLCCCLVALATADKLGYNYQPVSHSDSGLSFGPGAGTAASNVAPSILGGPGLATDGGFSADRGFQPSGPIAEQTAGAPNYAAPQAELQKEFFTYTADEEDFNDPAASEQLSTALNKALRVVFVKGPEHSGLEDAALALAKQAAQQETSIYVLNKQADIGDLANKLNHVHKNTNNKPEVHFVKYRTNEDADNAQKAITGQYDQLGGATSHQDGGVAPVLNFASSAPVGAAVPAASGHAPVAVQPEATAPISSYIPPVTPGSTYLPANILRLFRL